MEMMIITSGLRTVHHRDTERTEDAQRKKKNENYGLGSHACSFFVLKL